MPPAIQPLRTQPIVAVLFLAGTVLALIAILILLGRWNIPKPLSAMFFAGAALLCAPYVASTTWRLREDEAVTPDR